MRSGLFRENQAKDCQEIEESRRICCGDTDQTRQARIDELSMHQEESVCCGSVFDMTKDTAKFSQVHAVTCREYTLPSEEGASQPKGWIQGNTQIGPVLEVTTCCLHGKYGVEIRIMSLNRDNSQSWVRIFMDQTKL